MPTSMFFKVVSLLYRIQMKIFYSGVAITVFRYGVCVLKINIKCVYLTKKRAYYYYNYIIFLPVVNFSSNLN